MRENGVNVPAPNTSGNGPDLQHQRHRHEQRPVQSGRDEVPERPARAFRRSAPAPAEHRSGRRAVAKPRRRRAAPRPGAPLHRAASPARAGPADGYPPEAGPERSLPRLRLLGCGPGGRGSRRSSAWRPPSAPAARRCARAAVPTAPRSESLATTTGEGAVCACGCRSAPPWPRSPVVSAAARGDGLEVDLDRSRRASARGERVRRAGVAASG